MTNGARRLKQKLEEKRKGKPHTQADLARALGVTAQSVNQWMTGVTCPAGRHMAALEQMFGIRASEWLDGEAGAA